MDWCVFISTRRKCVAIFCFMAILQPVTVQFLMPGSVQMLPAPSSQQMYPGGSPGSVLSYPIGPQVTVMQVGVPPPQKIEAQNKPDKDVAVAYPVPMPMPMQIGVPAQQPSFCAARQRPPNCPPCPPCLCAPSCTPAFFSFCSPCHQKCRCVDPNQVPVPLPPVAPMAAVGPAYPMPALLAPMPPIAGLIPPSPPRPQYGYPRYSSSDSDTSCSDTSSSDTSSSDSSSDYDQYRRSGSRKKRRRNFKKIRRRKMRSRRTMNGDDDDLKPVLSFVNTRGDVKLKKTISSHEAAQLMGDYNNKAVRDDNSNGGMVQDVRVLTDEDEEKNQQLVLEADFKGRSLDTRRSKQLVLRKAGQQLLQEGRKSLVFKPPHNKQISNLSVSFQVS